MANTQWPEFLTVEEVATIMRVSKMTVYRLLHNGELDSTRVGRSFRVLSTSLRSYIDGNPGSDPELRAIPSRDTTADIVARIDQGITRR